MAHPKDKKRMIYADVLVQDINADPYRTESEKSYDRCLVHRQPTVDAVEVVRCGNCKYFNEPFCVRRDDETHRERINMLTVDFCSYGKRRNDG